MSERQYPRVKVPRAERVSVNEEFAPVDAFINEWVSDVSLSGAFIRSKEPLPVGTRVNLKFSLIMDELHVVEGAGEVVRQSMRPRGMAVQFLQLRGDGERVISRAVAIRRRARQDQV
jgi:hypothetical protein